MQKQRPDIVLLSHVGQGSGFHRMILHAIILSRIVLWFLSQTHFSWAVETYFLKIWHSAYVSHCDSFGIILSELQSLFPVWMQPVRSNRINLLPPSATWSAKFDSGVPLLLCLALGGVLSV